MRPSQTLAVYTINWQLPSLLPFVQARRQSATCVSRELHIGNACYTCHERNCLILYMIDSCMFVVFGRRSFLVCRLRPIYSKSIWIVSCKNHALWWQVVWMYQPSFKQKQLPLKWQQSNGIRCWQDTHTHTHTLTRTHTHTLTNTHVNMLTLHGFLANLRRTTATFFFDSLGEWWSRKPLKLRTMSCLLSVWIPARAFGLSYFSCILNVLEDCQAFTSVFAYCLIAHFKNWSTDKASAEPMRNRCSTPLVEWWRTICSYSM